MKWIPRAKNKIKSKAMKQKTENNLVTDETVAKAFMVGGLLGVLAHLKAVGAIKSAIESSGTIGIIEWNLIEKKAEDRHTITVTMPVFALHIFRFKFFKVGCIILNGSAETTEHIKTVQALQSVISNGFILLLLLIGLLTCCVFFHH